MNANEDEARREAAERPLSGAESARLSELRSGPELPAELERAVIGDLRARGLLSAPRAPRGGAGLRSAAAALLAGLVGLAVGRTAWVRSATEVTRAPGERYLLLVHDPLAAPALEPEELERRIGEYAHWAASLGEAMLGGAHLAEQAALLHGDPAGGVTVERASGSESSLGGYFLLAAPGQEEAEAIARTCPHLRHGGWLELRRLDERGEG